MKQINKPGSDWQKNGTWKVVVGMLGFSLLGVVVAIILLIVLQCYCSGSLSFYCVSVKEHPPWTQVAAIVAAFPILYWWILKAIYRSQELKIQSRQVQLAEELRDLQQQTQELDRNERTIEDSFFSALQEVMLKLEPNGRTASPDKRRPQPNGVILSFGDPERRKEFLENNPTIKKALDDMAEQARKNTELNVRNRELYEKIMEYRFRPRFARSTYGTSYW